MNEMTHPRQHSPRTARPIRYSADGKDAVNFSVLRSTAAGMTAPAGQWTPTSRRSSTGWSLSGSSRRTPRTSPSGTAVTVTGELADDSWTPEDGKRVYRTQLIAADVAVSLGSPLLTITRNRAATATAASRGRPRAPHS